MKTGYVFKVFLNSLIDKSYVSLFTLLQTRNFQGILASHLLHKACIVKLPLQFNYRFWTLHILIAKVNAEFSPNAAAHVCLYELFTSLSSCYSYLQVCYFLCYFLASYSENLHSLNQSLVSLAYWYQY